MVNYEACPVSLKTVNEHRVRLTAFFVLAAFSFFLYTRFWPLLLLLLADFLLRATGFGKYSVFHFLSGRVLGYFNREPKMVDQAPKQFAARIGFTLTLLIIATFATGFTSTSFILSAAIIFFAFLESFFGFCTGCYLYNFYKKKLGKSF